MRPAGPVWILPCPALLWILVLAGHALSSAAPIPALLVGPLRAAAVLSGALSLGAALLAAKIRSNSRTTAAAERVLGWVALLATGAALGSEADLLQWPLPVHPREVEVVVEGLVLDTAGIDARSPSVRFEVRRLRVGEVEAACHARVLLRWGPQDPPPRWMVPGLWLRVGGAYRPPEDARNFGTGAPGRRLERVGLSGSIRVDPRTVVAPAAPPTRGAGWDTLVRDRAARALSRLACHPVAALARGMLLGDRSGVDPEVRRSFRDGGTIHILSISGLHVVILAGFIAAAAAALRLPGGAAVGLELGALWAYVLLVGTPASALRSALLWSTMRLGRVWGRVVRPFAAWGLAGLLLHLLDPRAVLDPGFQLSFTAVLGIGAAGPLTPARRESTGSAIGSSARAVASLFVQSAGAAAGTAGLQMGLFGAAPLSGLLLNLAVIPLCTVFMGTSILALVAGSTGVEPLAQMSGGALDACGLVLLGIHALGARALPPWILRDPPPLLVLAISSGALLASWALGEGARSGAGPLRRARLGSLAAFAISLAAPVAWTLAVPPPPRTEAVVVALDVGQGDATWIGLPGSGSILIDAGPEADGYDAGSAVVEPALRAERSRPVLLAILSHAHSDHYGGLPWLAGRGWIGTLLENGSSRGASWRGRVRGKWWGAVPRAVSRDTLLHGGPNDWSVSLRTGLASGAENDRSLAALVRWGDVTALFPGDLETAGEAALLRRLGGGSPAAVVKAPHHGSRTSSGVDWVTAWSPDVVIVSCGERNRFGHPDPAVVGRYEGGGALVLRTDREGAIRVTIAPRGAWVSSRADPQPRFVPWRSRVGITPSLHSP